MRLTILVAVLAFLAIIAIAGYFADDLDNYFAPPRVGENVEAVIQRLGRPHFDSRFWEEPDPGYDLSFSTRQGWVYHVHVKDGLIARVTKGPEKRMEVEVRQ